MASTPSLRARALSLTLRCTVRPIISLWALAPGLPWPYGVVDHAGRLAHRPCGTRFTPVDLGYARAQWVDPADEATDRVILYLHGGAFLVGGWHLHRGMVGHLAARARARVLMVEYRKLPRHSLLDASADALDAYRLLLSEGIAPQRIVVMGDSAGGFLALLLAAHLSEAGLPRPAGLVALSPLLDLDPTPGEGRGCAVLTPRAVSALARASRVGAAELLTPMTTSGHHLPPTLIQSGLGETLHRQAVAYAEALAELGVPHELQLWPVDIHVFQAARWLPEAREAWDRVVDFLDALASTYSGVAGADA